MILEELNNIKNTIRQDETQLLELLGIILQHQIDGDRATNETYTIRDNSVLRYNASNPIYSRYIIQNIDEVTEGMGIDRTVRDKIGSVGTHLGDFDHRFQLRWRKDEPDRNRTWLLTERAFRKPIEATTLGVLPTERQDGSEYQCIKKWMELEYNTGRKYYPHQGLASYTSWDTIQDGAPPRQLNKISADEHDICDPTDLAIVRELFTTARDDMVQYRDNARAALEALGQTFPKEEIMRGL